MFTKETLIELAKDAPIPAVGAMTLFGVPVNGIILTATVIWAVWRVIDSVLNTYWKWQDRKALAAKLREKTLAEALEERNASK